MYCIPQEVAWNWPDVASFIEIVNRLGDHRFARLEKLWNPADRMFVTRAPGRLDVMGGIADYSGSLVLQLPIREATLVALQLDEQRHLTLASLSGDRDEKAAVFSMGLEDFELGGRPISYAEARNTFKKDPDRAWAAYAAGSFLVLMREKGVVFPRGARILIDSSVPEGKGVSSSAALEVAVMMAVGAAFNLDLDPHELADLCQKVENLVVGAPCGIMDQMTSVFGEENRLLSLLCQPAEIQASLPIPEELAFWGIDSGIRHAVSGADYTSVRVGAFMGYTILKKLADKDWGGYLANLTPSELEQKYMSHLPEAVKGGDFLARYGSTDDTVAEIDPDITYAVRQSTAHPVYERSRLRAFSRLLTENAIAKGPPLGELMVQSHASYSACGLGSEGTDTLVELACEAGRERGIFGAKITGGGCGGTVAILGRRDAEPAVRAIAESYAQTTGHKPYLFTGSSPGAAAFGHLHL